MTGGKSSKFSDIRVRFGRAIQHRRKELELTQDNLAQRSGLHRTYIASVESGKKNVSIQNIEKLTKALEITISQLFAEYDID